MPKLLLPGVFFIIFSISLQAQQANKVGSKQANSYEYYIRISGINSRQRVEDLQQMISKNPGIKFFMANRYPVRYFLMRTEKEVTATTFEQWLRQSSATLEFFGEGIKAKEQAVLIDNKIKAQ